MSSKHVGKVPVVKEILNKGSKMKVTYWVTPSSAEHHATKAVLDSDAPTAKKSELTGLHPKTIEDYHEAHGMGSGLGGWAKDKAAQAAKAPEALKPKPPEKTPEQLEKEGHHATIAAQEAKGAKVSILKEINHPKGVGGKMTVAYQVWGDKAKAHVEAGGKLNKKQPEPKDEGPITKEPEKAKPAEPAPEKPKEPDFSTMNLPGHAGLPSWQVKHWTDNVIPAAVKAGNKLAVKDGSGHVMLTTPENALKFVNAGGHLASPQEAKAAGISKLANEHDAPPQPAAAKPLQKPLHAHVQTTEQKQALLEMGDGSHATLGKDGVPILPAAKLVSETHGDKPHIKATLEELALHLGATNVKASLAALKDHFDNGTPMSKSDVQTIDDARRNAMRAGLGSQTESKEHEMMDDWTSSASASLPVGSKQALRQTGLASTESGGNAISGAGTVNDMLKRAGEARMACTQAIMKAAGITHVRIFRGISHKQAVQVKAAHPGIGIGGIAKPAVWEMSSWTTNKEQAHSFGASGMTFEVHVPVEHIYASWHSDKTLSNYGSGSYSSKHGEEEVILARRLGHPPAKVINSHI